MAYNDYTLVKKAHTKQEYTKQQIKELIECSNPYTGAFYFSQHFFHIQHPVKGQMLFQPYDYQLKLLETYVNYRLSINMLFRQGGKTTTAAAYLLWFAMFNDDKTILIAAHRHGGALEIMQRIRYGYEMCPDHIRGGAVSYNKGSIEFDNGSRIIATTTTENTGRGMSISCISTNNSEITVRDKITGEIKTINIKQLIDEIKNNE